VQAPEDQQANSQIATALEPTYMERTLQEVELDHIAQTLKYTQGQKNRAASILGIERSTLDRKLKRLQEGT
jgi:Nif-specific regulatory protein